MAIRAYTSPGVSVSETISPALAPLVAGPSVIAIVGAAAGKQSSTERILLGGTQPVPVAVTLRHTGVSVGTVVVRTSADNVVIPGGSYLITAGADPDPSVSGDVPYTITALHPPPDPAPTVSNAGVGTLIGIYRYAVSFVNPGGETGIGSASPETTFATTGANLTAIPIDTRAGTATTARNVYRAKVTAGVAPARTDFHLVAAISGNVTTTLTNETMTDVNASLAPSPPVGIGIGDTISVSYDYTDQYYNVPTFVSDYDDIVDKYGAPFDATGNIVSPLSFAARLAFQNGASEVLAVASVDGTDQALADSFKKLESEEEVRIVTVASGSATVHTALAAHCTAMNSLGRFRQGIVGRDGSSTPVSGDTLRAAAQGLNNEAMILVAPATLLMQNPITGADLKVGGQYAAAAVAGMFSARDVQVPLTRKTVSGFTSLPTPRTVTEQALDSQAGLFVIVNKGGVMQIRHQVTTAPSNTNTAEASVVRAKYEMAHRLQDVLDGSIVGTVLPINDAPLIIGSVVSGVLEQLVVEGAIDTYANVKARILDTDPTTAEVRFEYRPQYPINNVIVRFTINTSTGDFALVA